MEAATRFLEAVVQRFSVKKAVKKGEISQNSQENRDRSRTAATSKMEHFAIIVNG